MLYFPYGLTFGFPVPIVSLLVLLTSIASTSLAFGMLFTEAAVGVGALPVFFAVARRIRGVTRAEPT